MSGGPTQDAADPLLGSRVGAYLVRALETHDGNISRTAEAIGMVRQSLQQKLKELGIRAKDHGGDA